MPVLQKKKHKFKTLFFGMYKIYTKKGIKF